MRISLWIHECRINTLLIIAGRSDLRSHLQPHLPAPTTRHPTAPQGAPSHSLLGTASSRAPPCAAALALPSRWPMCLPPCAAWMSVLWNRTIYPIWTVGKVHHVHYGASNSASIWTVGSVLCHSCMKMRGLCGVYVILVRVLYMENFMSDDIIATSWKKVYMTVWCVYKNEQNGLN